MKKKSGICFVFHILVKKFHGISTVFVIDLSVSTI